jgi:hypothetical protein
VEAVLAKNIYAEGEHGAAELASYLVAEARALDARDVLSLMSVAPAGATA